MVDLTKAKIGDTVIDNNGNTGVITEITLFNKYNYIVRFVQRGLDKEGL